MTTGLFKMVPGAERAALRETLCSKKLAARPLETLDSQKLRELIKRHFGSKNDISTLPALDQAVYEMYAKALRSRVRKEAAENRHAQESEEAGEEEDENIAPPKKKSKHKPPTGKSAMLPEDLDRPPEHPPRQRQERNVHRNEPDRDDRVGDPNIHMPMRRSSKSSPPILTALHDTQYKRQCMRENVVNDVCKKSTADSRAGQRHRLAAAALVDVLVRAGVPVHAAGDAGGDGRYAIVDGKRVYYFDGFENIKLVQYMSSA